MMRELDLAIIDAFLDVKFGEERESKQQESYWEDEPPQVLSIPSAREDISATGSEIELSSERRLGISPREHVRVQGADAAREEPEVANNGDERQEDAGANSQRTLEDMEAREDPKEDTEQRSKLQGGTGAQDAPREDGAQDACEDPREDSDDAREEEHPKEERVAESRDPDEDLAEGRIDMNKYYDEMELSMEKRFRRVDESWGQISVIMANLQKQMDETKLMTVDAAVSVNPYHLPPGESQAVTTFAKSKVALTSLVPPTEATTEVSMDSPVSATGSSIDDLKIAASPTEELEESIEASFPQLTAFVNQLKFTSSTAIAETLSEKNDEEAAVDAPSDEETAKEKSNSDEDISTEMNPSEIETEGSVEVPLTEYSTAESPIPQENEVEESKGVPLTKRDTVVSPIPPENKVEKSVEVPLVKADAAKVSILTENQVEESVEAPPSKSESPAQDDDDFFELIPTSTPESRDPSIPQDRCAFASLNPCLACGGWS